jgi:hypothetical protein
MHEFRDELSLEELTDIFYERDELDVPTIIDDFWLHPKLTEEMKLEFYLSCKNEKTKQFIGKYVLNDNPEYWNSSRSPILK